MTRLASERASASCLRYSSSSSWASFLDFSASSSADWMLPSRASTVLRMAGNATRMRTKATTAKQMTPQISSAVAGRMRSSPEVPCSWARSSPAWVIRAFPLEDEGEDEADERQRLHESEADERGDAGLSGHLRLASVGLDRAREHEPDSDARAYGCKAVDQDVRQGLKPGVGEATALLGQVDDRISHSDFLPFLAGAGGSRNPFGFLKRVWMFRLVGVIALAVAVQRLGDVEGGQGREDVGLDADHQELEDDQDRGHRRGEQAQRQGDVQRYELEAEQKEDREQHVARHHVRQESNREGQRPDDEGREDLDRRQQDVHELGYAGREHDPGEVVEPLLANALEDEGDVGEQRQSERYRHPRRHRKVDERDDLEQVHEEDEPEERRQVVGEARPVLGPDDVDRDLVADEQVRHLRQVLDALRNQRSPTRPRHEEGYADGGGKEH